MNVDFSLKHTEEEYISYFFFFFFIVLWLGAPVLTTQREGKENIAVPGEQDLLAKCNPGHPFFVRLLKPLNRMQSHYICIQATRQTEDWASLQWVKRISDRAA